MGVDKYTPPPPNVYCDEYKESVCPPIPKDWRRQETNRIISNFRCRADSPIVISVSRGNVNDGDPMPFPTRRRPAQTSGVQKTEKKAGHLGTYTMGEARRINRALFCRSIPQCHQSDIKGRGSFRSG